MHTQLVPNNAHSEQNKPDTTFYILFCFFYVKLQIRQNYEIVTESISVCPWFGVGEVQHSITYPDGKWVPCGYCIMKTQSLFFTRKL